MKHLTLTILLISLTSALFAQEQSKRPSWSQGLPERQTSQLPGNPGLESKENKTAIQSQPEISIEKPAAPEIKIELSTQPEMEFKVEPNAIEQPLMQPIRRAGQRRLNNRTIGEKVSNPLHQQYSWSLVKTEPIDITSRHATKNQLKVRIYINPEGQVVRVAAGAPDVPALMLKEAQQSIQQWQFEPPKEIGITDNLVKTFTIEIKTS